jgi:uncharacterized membrane protein
VWNKVTPPEEARFEALAEEMVRLTRRQTELEERIREVEARTGAAREAPPPLPVAPQAPPLPPLRPFETPEVFEPPPQPAEQAALETQVGLNWVNRVAVVTLILGAGFFFKYAVDNNWIGPGARVVLGVITAGIALAAGDRLWRKQQKVFAQGILGLGLALFYLSFWAASSFYELIPNATAFVLMAATTAGAGYLALRYESQAVAVLGMIGGYLTPVALSTGQDHPWILFSYVSLLNLGALVLARVRPWQALEPGALVATMLLYIGWADSWFTAANRLVATVFALVFYAEFFLTRFAPVWFVIQLAAPLTLAAIWGDLARFLPYGLLLGTSGLAVAERRTWAAAPSWTLLCFWLASWFSSITAGAPDNRSTVFAWLSLGFLLFFLWVPWWTLWNARAPRSGDLLVPAGNAAAYFAASYWLLNPVRHEWMGLLAVSIGGLHLALARALWKPSDAPEEETWPALVAAGVALTFVTLAVPIQFTAFRITIAWAIEGAAATWVATRFRKQWLAIAATVVFALTLARLFGSDAWMFTSGDQYSAIANARFLAFAVSSVSLWLAARFIGSGAFAGTAYVAGHFAMLWALGLEVSGWVDRSIASPDAASVLTMAISILMAVYALLLVALGTLARAAVHRMLGLALIAIVVAKLYLWDVWQLGRVFRITAFLALGALLLAVSYLYSRFRSSIDKLGRALKPF